VNVQFLIVLNCIYWTVHWIFLWIKNISIYVSFQLMNAMLQTWILEVI